MKRTTTRVFVSPVHLHCRSRTIQGWFGSAAGAHTLSLPAAQEGQPKSGPGLAACSPSVRWGCSFLLVLTSLVLCAPGYADKTAKTTSMVQPLTGKTPESLKITEKLAETCRQTDPVLAPAMVVIAPGRFKMGSPADEKGRDTDESPQHLVTIPRPFAISRCEITVGQFRQFIKDTGYQTTAEQLDDQGKKKGCNQLNPSKSGWELNETANWHKPGFDQSEQQPVVCVSWHDAQRYVDWLSQRTGALYRLPTEAEWEYAARGGTVSPRYFIDNKQCDYANGLGQEAKSIADKIGPLADCSDPFIYTAPVASFAENPFGLFDMLGNVWEWTLDCYHTNYQDNAPYDGSAWLQENQGDCDRRVVRGGSGLSYPQNLRSADRNWIITDETYDIQGFRIARAL